jgi:hypothetical protein
MTTLHLSSFSAGLRRVFVRVARRRGALRGAGARRHADGPAGPGLDAGQPGAPGRRANAEAHASAYFTQCAS